MWSRSSNSALVGAAMMAVLLLSACGSTPPAPPEPRESRPAGPGEKPAPKDGSATTQGVPDSAAATPAEGAAPLRPVPPPRAVADFERAVNLMRAGKTTDAELEFGQLASAYPQLATPLINLGLLQRKGGRLEQAEQSLKGATERNP